MFRTLAAALLVATIATAHAQTVQLPPGQQIQRQQPTLPAPQLQTGSYVYTARTAAPVRRSGAVTASGITWACQGTSCTVTGPWPQPGVGACTALMREVGRITAYGRQGAMLNTAQLAQCNASLLSPPPPPAPPPPPPPPPPEHTQTFTYTARTALTVRRVGAVTAGGISWTCSATSCTAAGPWPQPGVGSCAALSREVGQITSYGRPGAALNIVQLTQCNVGTERPTTPPTPAADPSARGPITVPELSVIGGGPYVPPPPSPPTTITVPELSVVGGGAYAPPASAPPITIATPELSVVGQ
jgi:hypothetical protein